MPLSRHGSALRGALRSRRCGRDRGAYLVWQYAREDASAWLALAGVGLLGAYGFVATFQPDNNFGRVLAAYGGVFVAGSLLWGVAFDGIQPDRYDLIGAGICLLGVGIIMYAPR